MEKNTMGKNKKAEETESATEAEATEAATNADKPVAEKMPEQNGVRRPRAGTATGRVWEIADELSSDGPAARADVLKAFEGEGGNAATGATQYGRWRKFHGLGRTVKAAKAEVAA